MTPYYQREGVTLYHGDALDLLRSLRMHSVDAIITDPPYGINTKSDGMGKLSPWADYCNSAFWYAEWIKECQRVIRPTGCLWSFLNWRSLVTFQKAACDVRWPIESLLVWDKEWIGPGGTRGLRPSYEMVALWAGDRFVLDDRGIPDIRRSKWSGHKPNGHPAEKPEELIRWLIETSLHTGAVVVDPFAGSGTTGAACIASDREFVGCELDEHWVEYAARRLDAALSQGSLFTHSNGIAA